MPTKIAPSREELLTEYDFCHRTASSMETTIWQTGAAMSLGLVGAFFLVAMREASAQPPWWAAGIMGTLSFAVSLIWWFIARRWWSVQHAMFFRMRHIERALGLHSLWYVQYLDNPDLIEKAGLPKSDAADLQARAANMNSIGIKEHQTKGTQSVLWLMPFVIFGIWAIYSFGLLINQLFGAG